MTEHRKHPRKQIHPVTSWGHPGGAPQPARCRDLSLGGAFLEIDGEPPPFGAAVIVYLELPGLPAGAAGQPGAAAVSSTVRWTTRDGMGVQFGTMGVRETHALVQALASAG